MTVGGGGEGSGGGGDGSGGGVGGGDGGGLGEGGGAGTGGGEPKGEYFVELKKISAVPCPVRCSHPAPKPVESPSPNASSVALSASACCLSSTSKQGGRNLIHTRTGTFTPNTFDTLAFTRLCCFILHPPVKNNACIQRLTSSVEPRVEQIRKYMYTTIEPQKKNK